MILGDVEETITSIEIDDETYEEIVKAGLFVHMQCCGKLNATPNSVSGFAADKQAHGPLPVCKRGWCHFGLTTFEVMMVVSTPSTNFNIICVCCC